MVIPDATHSPFRRLAVLFLVALLMLSVGCQQSSDDAPVDSPAGAADAEEVDGAVLRDLAFEYWKAFNEYDVDRVLAFLQPAYRAEREEQVREDIGRLEQFSVELGVSEHLPPHVGESGQWEMFLVMETPIDVRRLRMQYQKDRDRWWITHAEEVE